MKCQINSSARGFSESLHLMQITHQPYLAIAVCISLLHGPITWSACRNSADGHTPQHDDIIAECLPQQHVQRLVEWAVSPVTRLYAWLEVPAWWSLPSVHLLLAQAVPLLLLKTLAQPHHWGSCLVQGASCFTPVTRVQPLLPRLSDFCSFCSAHCSICTGAARSMTGLHLLTQNGGQGHQVRR